MATAIGTAYVNIKPTFQGLQKETRKGLTGVEVAFDESGQRSGGRFTRAVGGVAKAGLVAAGAAAAAGFGAALVKGFGRLTAIENAEAKLTGLGHSAQTVETIMTNALAAVKGTAFGLDEAATVAAQVVAAGIKPGQELEDVLRLTGDAATIAGVSMGEMGSIFSKVASSNKVQGEIINQLNERGIPIVQLLAKELGITSEEVLELSRKGQIGFAEFQAAMESGMGGAALKSGETFQGAWANVGAALGRIGATLLAPFFALAKDGMNSLTVALDAINEALGPVMDGFAQWLGSIDWAGVAQQMGGLFAPLLEAFGPLVPTLIEAALALSPIKLAFEALAPYLPLLAQAVGTLAGALAAILGEALRFVVPLLANLAATILPILMGALQQLIPIVMMAAQFLGQYWGVMLQALAPVMMVIVTVLGQLWQAIQPILTAAIQLIGAILPPLMGIFVALTPVIQLLGTVLGFVAQVIGAVLVFAVQALAQIVQWAFPLIAGLIRVAATIITGIITGVVAVIRVLGTVFTWLYQNVVRPVWQLISTAISAAWNGIIRPIFNVITAVLRTILAPAFNVLSAVVRVAWAAIQMAIQVAWTFIRDTIFTPLRNWIHNTIRPAFTSLRDTVTTVWNGIQSIVNRVYQWVKKNVFDPLAATVEKHLPGAFKAGRDAIGKFWDGLKAIARKPVAFVVETIVRDGLVKPFNKVADFFNVDGIDEKYFTVPKLWTGGPVPGHSPTDTADNIPIWATAGEYMIRRPAVRRLERMHPGVLDHINKYGSLPGFARGGLVELGRTLQQFGVRVAGHPAFPPIGRHSRNSEHYVGRAIDLNYGPGGRSAQETAFFNQLAPLLHQLGWGVIWQWKGHYGHLHVGTNQTPLGNWSRSAPPGALEGGLAQALQGITNGEGRGGGFDLLAPFRGLIDKIMEGVGDSPMAQMVGAGGKKLVEGALDWMTDRLTSVGDVFGGAAASVADTATKARVRAVATGFGWGFGREWDALVQLIQKESSWNPNAANPTSSARGLFQKMTSLHGPLESTVEGQAGWGLNYIKRTYGSPSKAWAFHQRNNWYADGGPIQPPTLYDTGGWIPPGVTTVLNATGKPEPVLTTRQLAALEAAAVGRGGGAPLVENLYAQDMDDAVRKLRLEQTRERVLHPVGV